MKNRRMENKDGWHLESSPQFLIHHIGITVINQKKKSSKLSIAWKAISELFKVWGTKIEPTPHIKDKYFYYPKYQMWFMSRGFQCPNRSQVLQRFPSLKIEKKSQLQFMWVFIFFYFIKTYWGSKLPWLQTYKMEIDAIANWHQGQTL